MNSLSRAAACTVVAKNWLSHARVLARSFRVHHPRAPFFVLLADEVQGAFRPADEPFTLVELAALRIEGLEGFRFRYAPQPFSYACTPFLIAWLLRQGYDRVVYFKQETLVVGSLAPLIERLDTTPIVITPHLVEPLAGPDAAAREINILQSGIYNVGILGVGAPPASSPFLSWWQQRLLTHCRHDVAAGLHFEQRWIDLVPAYFDGVHVLRDPAYNIGHWSLPERHIDVDPAGGVLVDGRACRVVRFSGYRPENPERATVYNDRLPWNALGPMRLLFERFRHSLLQEGYSETSTWPYAFGAFDNGVPVPDIARAIYRDLGPQAAAFGDPLRTSSPFSFWRWLFAPDPETRLPRLWHAIYRARPDLQQAYPTLDEPGRAAFMHWARASGLAEHQLSDAFLDRGQT